MASNELILTFTDHSGRRRRVTNCSARVTIGRDSANDVAIEDSNLSRHHAVIERVRDSFQITDCNSRNGTTVNGHPVAGSMELLDGDVINLAGVYDINVSLQRIPANPTSVSLSLPTISGIAILLIVVGAVALLAFPGLYEPSKHSAEANITPEPPRKNREVAHPSPETRNVDTAPAETLEEKEQLEAEIKRVMSKLSNDNAPYISEAGVNNVRQQLEKLRGSPELKEKLRAAKTGCPEITAQAQRVRVRPALLMYAALADSGGDPVAAARRLAPAFLTLRATFGTETANSSLLIVAAYPYPFNPALGSQTRTPHPLASKLVELGGRRSTVDTSEARSVWFLREKNGITDEAYELVTRLLAIGVIVQNPAQYSIDAESPLC